MEPDYLGLPAGLPVPVDDGAARRLPGRAMPAVTLARSDGGEVRLADLGPGRTVLYLYPMTGRPGTPLPAGWDEIPGARGCTPESCGFRDHHAELQAAGAARVFGMSSDEALAVADALDLPTFVVAGLKLYRRLTMIVTGGVIEHVFYPVFPPDQHAAEVLEWLREHPAPVTAHPSGG
jgi:peroxiredoxin